MAMTDTSVKAPPARQADLAARRRGLLAVVIGKAPFLGLLAVLLIVWELVPRLADIHQIVLPPFSRVANQLLSNIPMYVVATGQTFSLVLVGFVAGAVFGFLSAVAIFYSSFFRRAVYPYLFAFRIVPKLAFLPLFLLWFGTGATTKVVLAATAIFFLVLVQVLLGLYGIDDEFIEFGRSLKMRETEIFRRIRLPAAMPSMMVGLKMGVTYALTNVIVAEMVVAHTGLGILLVDGRYRMRTYEVLAAIVVVSLAGLAVYVAAAYVERKTTSWHYSE